MLEIPLKIGYFERGLSKTLKKAHFVFPSEPGPILMYNIIRKGASN